MRFNGSSGSRDDLPLSSKRTAAGAPASQPHSSRRIEPAAELSGFTRLVSDVIGDYLGDKDRKATLTVCEAAAGAPPGGLAAVHLPVIVSYVERALRFYQVSDARRAECLGRLRALVQRAQPRPAAEEIIPIDREEDVVHARTAARAMCERIGFPVSGQTRIATAVSELARNIWAYAGRGRIVLRPLGDGAGIEVVARDEGPGIADIDAVLSPRYRSRSGMGVGLQGTRRLVDYFAITSQPGRGTTVTLRKFNE